MKVRTDFVTNSSSSSFILARNAKMNEKQKEAVLNYVENQFFGTPILTPESTEEDIQKAREEEWEYFYDDDVRLDNIREALREGKSIYSGTVWFECCENDYAEIFTDIWSLMEQHSEGDFKTIDNDLSY